MIKNKLQNKRHVIVQEEKKHSPEELKLMKTQDEKYVHMKLSTEKKVFPPLQNTLFIDNFRKQRG